MGANTNVKAAPSAYETSVSKLIKGFTQVMPPKAIVVVSGGPMTQVQILAKLQAILDEYQAIHDARAALQGKLQSAKGNRSDEHEFLMQLHGALVAYFGRKSPELAQFGYTPTKQKQTTSAKNTAAAAKRSVTRKMRHTMGSKEKQQVKAAVTPDVAIINGKVIITDPKSPPAGSPETAPQNGAAGGTSASGA